MNTRSAQRVRLHASHHPRGRGFALVESLVALVLLGLGLLGAASTMIQGQAQLRATLLATRAAGLAGDLAERLHAEPDASDIPSLLAAWQLTVQQELSTGIAADSAQGQLDAADAGSGELPFSHSVTIEWLDPASHTQRRLELPVMLPASEPAS